MKSTGSSFAALALAMLLCDACGDRSPPPLRADGGLGNPNCTTLANCARKTYGSPCSSATDCTRDLSCVSGTCVCATGSTYCPAKKLCLLSNECCSTSDCGTGKTPDACHLELACVDSKCTYPSKCANGSQICSDGVCRCPPGRRLCGAGDICIPITLCCDDASCTTPPDTCHSARNASCTFGACVYPLIACEPDQICVAGTCNSSALTLRAEIPSGFPSSFAYDPTPPSGTRSDTTNITRLHIQFTIINTSASPVEVYPGVVPKVRVYSFKKNGVPLPVLGREFPHPLETETYDAMKALGVIAPRGSLTSPVYSADRSNFFSTGDLAKEMLQRVYRPDGPGHYTVVFAYVYSRGFAGTLLSNEVSFDLY